MTAESIGALLTSQIIGKSVHVFDEVTSTNDLLKQAGEAGEDEGLVYFAESQTKGRGRLGRRWESVSGASLLFSILLRPSWADTSCLSLAMAVALAETLDLLTSASARIKWPNDVYIKNKKVAGILCEACSGFFVVGIGLNVLQKNHDFPESLQDHAGSIAMYSEQIIDRSLLAANLLNNIDRIYNTLPSTFPEIIQDCESRSFLIGKKVSITRGHDLFEGLVTGLDSDGALIVQDKSDKKIIVNSGEVNLLSI
jgi:BirA family transcriptional regulator, biotin operon repressor / biotin---[acetyl-CoA-carboxylase] ligase